MIVSDTFSTKSVRFSPFRIRRSREKLFSVGHLDSVIDASPLKNSNNPRQEIELLLWYYYKGDVDLIKEAICAIPR